MNLDKDIFEILIEQTDTKLSEDNTPIPARPVRATINILNEYMVSGPLFNSSNTPLEYPVTEDNLFNHVDEWYSERYKEQLYIDPSPGRFPILVGGASYECKIPLMIGTFHIVSSKEKFESVSILNAVEHITGLTRHVRQNMTSIEENLLQVMFFICLEVTREIRTNRSKLIASAESDAHIACELVCGYKQNPSLSAWHSLQFAEKILKEFISQKGVYPQTHNINRLKLAAIELGYSPDPKINWNLFNFSASVRYDTDLVKLDEAIAINQEAWRVAYTVLKQI